MQQLDKRSDVVGLQLREGLTNYKNYEPRILEALCDSVYSDSVALATASGQEPPKAKYLCLSVRNCICFSLGLLSFSVGIGYHLLYPSHC